MVSRLHRIPFCVAILSTSRHSRSLAFQCLWHKLITADLPLNVGSMQQMITEPSLCEFSLRFVCSRVCRPSICLVQESCHGNTQNIEIKLKCRTTKLSHSAKYDPCLMCKSVYVIGISACMVSKFCSLFINLFIINIYYLLFIFKHT